MLVSFFWIDSSNFEGNFYKSFNKVIVEVFILFNVNI